MEGELTIRTKVELDYVWGGHYLKRDKLAETHEHLNDHFVNCQSLVWQTEDVLRNRYKYLLLVL